MKKITIILGALLLAFVIFSGWLFTQWQGAKQSARVQAGKSSLYRAFAADQNDKRFPDTLFHAANAIGFAGYAAESPSEDAIQPEGPFLNETDDPEKYSQATDWISKRPGYLPFGSKKLASEIDVFAVSPQGNFCIAGNEGGSQVWKFAKDSGEVTSGPLFAAAIHQDGKTVALATQESVTMKKEGQEISSWQLSDVTALAFDETDEKVAVCGGGNLYFLSNGKNEELGEVGAGRTQMAYAPGGTVLVVATEEKGISVFAKSSRRENALWKRSQIAAHSFSIDPVFGNDRLARGTKGGNIYLHRISDGTHLSEYHIGSAVNSLSIAPEGKALVVGSEDGVVRLFEVGKDHSLSPLASLNGHSAPIESVQFFADGKSLVSADRQGNVRLWSVDGESKPTELFSYFREGWYTLDDQSGQFVPGEADGFLNEPATSVVSQWKQGQTPAFPSTELPVESVPVLNPKENYTNSEGIELIWCAPGSFEMGEKEGPLFAQPYQATLSHGFWMSKTEITQAQYQTIVGSNPSANVDEKAPVENMQWAQANEFCDRLTFLDERKGVELKGWRYALPTEAQWEYACRAGSQTKWSFGSKALDLKKNGNFEVSDDGFSKAAPVASFPANPWGFHDLHGNVFEWCRDAMDSDNPDYPVEATTDPFVSKGSLRIVRGGSFDATPNECSSTYRDAQAPLIPNPNVGFRVVLVPEKSIR